MINRLVQFCDSNYNRPTQCPDCPNVCRGGCEACLDAVHKREDKCSYGCMNIAYFYVCKYIYKYSSEIGYIIKTLPVFDKYQILSIGCGPCTELIGVLNFLTNANQNSPVSFIGIDPNRIWEPIHGELAESVAAYPFEVKVQIQDENAFSFMARDPLRDSSWQPNLLILNYVFSDMKDNSERQKLVDDLVKFMLPYMQKNSYIILNDINHNTQARNYFDLLYKKTKDDYATSKVREGHFENTNKPNGGYGYGRRFLNNAITTSIVPNIASQYNPWKFCTSAQLVLQKGV